ncbi:MAG: DNA polymerase III subunit chi [Alphaproteobacteria bacterium]
MTDVMFYHLEIRTLADVLPGLLSRCLERGWRTVVQSADEGRLAALNDRLWTFDDAGFLPHGTTQDGQAAIQPIWLTTGTDNPNGATVRFLVDGAPLPEPNEAQTYDRIVFLFDGLDPDALGHARTSWKAAGESGHDAQYWRQDENGRWQQQEGGRNAESGGDGA